MWGEQAWEGFTVRLYVVSISLRDKILTWPTANIDDGEQLCGEWV